MHHDYDFHDFNLASTGTVQHNIKKKVYTKQVNGIPESCMWGMVMEKAIS